MSNIDSYFRLVSGYNVPKDRCLMKLLRQQSNLLDFSKDKHPRGVEQFLHQYDTLYRYAWQSTFTITDELIDNPVMLSVTSVIGQAQAPHTHRGRNHPRYIKKSFVAVITATALGHIHPMYSINSSVNIRTLTEPNILHSEIFSRNVMSVARNWRFLIALCAMRRFDLDPTMLALIDIHNDLFQVPHLTGSRRLVYTKQMADYIDHDIQDGEFISRTAMDRMTYSSPLTMSLPTGPQYPPLTIQMVNPTHFRIRADRPRKQYDHIPYIKSENIAFPRVSLNRPDVRRLIQFLGFHIDPNINLIKEYADHIRMESI